MKLLDYPGRSLYTTWNVSFKLVETQSPDAARLLRLFAYFDNGCIWQDLLKAGAVGDPSELELLIGSRGRFKAAVNKLVAYAFLEAVPSLSGEPSSRFRLHNCVHDWTLDILNSDLSGELFSIAYLGVTRSVAHDNKAWDYALNKPLIRHAVRLDHPRFAELIKRGEAGSLKFSHALGSLFKTQGYLVRAEKILQRLLVKRKGQLGLKDVATLQTAADLGEVYIKQKRVEEGLLLYHRILRCKPSTPSREHESLRWVTLGAIASVCEQQGRRAEAESHYRKALSEMEGLIGTQNIPCLLLRHQFGRFLVTKGALDEAAAIMRPALIVLQDILGPNSTPVLNMIDLLGYIFAQQGQMAHAEQLMQRAVRERSNLFGESHGSTLMALNNLAGIYGLQKKVHEAQAMFQRALAAQSEVTDKDSTCCLIKKNLASVYLDTGWWREAEQLWQEALAISITLDPTSEDTYEILAKLVMVNRKMNYKQKANDILSRIPREHRDRLLKPGGRPVAQNALVFITQLALLAVTGTGGPGLMVATGLHSFLDKRRVNAQRR